jgi:hypothetical protein
MHNHLKFDRPLPAAQPARAVIPLPSPEELFSFTGAASAVSANGTIESSLPFSQSVSWSTSSMTFSLTSSVGSSTSTMSGPITFCGNAICVKLTGTGSQGVSIDCDAHGYHMDDVYSLIGGCFVTYQSNKLYESFAENIGMSPNGQAAMTGVYAVASTSPPSLNQGFFRGVSGGASSAKATTTTLSMMRPRGMRGVSPAVPAHARPLADSGSFTFDAKMTGFTYNGTVMMLEMPVTQVVKWGNGMFSFTTSQSGSKFGGTVSGPYTVCGNALCVQMSGSSDEWSADCSAHAYAYDTNKHSIIGECEITLSTDGTKIYETFSEEAVSDGASATMGAAVTQFSEKYGIFQFEMSGKSA